MVTLRYIFFRKIRISDFLPLFTRFQNNELVLSHPPKNNHRLFFPQLKIKYFWCVLTYCICFSYWYLDYPIFDPWELLPVGTWPLLIEPQLTLIASCYLIRQDVPGLSCTFPASDLESIFSPWCSYSFWFNHCLKMLGPFEGNRLFLPTNVKYCGLQSIWKIEEFLIHFVYLREILNFLWFFFFLLEVWIICEGIIY